METHRIAVIAGDGIGKEVVPEGIRVLEAAGARHGIAFRWDELPWSCETYARTGRMMPEDGLERIRRTTRCSSARSATRASPITSRCGACSSPSGGASSST
jgi:isocitrate/isopropylmalate dehydrogenase